MEQGVVDVPYLALYQHGDVYEHVMQLLDATFQTDNVFVSGFDLTQSLFRDPRVHDLNTEQGVLLPHRLGTQKSWTHQDEKQVAMAS